MTCLASYRVMHAHGVHESKREGGHVGGQKMQAKVWRVGVPEIREPGWTEGCCVGWSIIAQPAEPCELGSGMQHEGIVLSLHSSMCAYMATTLW